MKELSELLKYACRIVKHANLDDYTVIFYSTDIDALELKRQQVRENDHSVIRRHGERVIYRDVAVHKGFTVYWFVA